MNELTIVERSSGFWVVDNSGPVEGPFETFEVAQSWIDAQNNSKAEMVAFMN